jgi:nucleotide-binding universal stress UspA family protein
MSMGIFGTILYCTDFSETADRAFDYALNLAETYGSTLVILHATYHPVYPVLAEPYVMSQAVEHAEGRLRQEAEEEIRRRYVPRLPAQHPHEILVRSGTPAQEVLQVIRQRGVNLVVMGARGRSPIELLMFGSVAQRVVRRSPVPVLTVSARPSER